MVDVVIVVAFGLGFLLGRWSAAHPRVSSATRIIVDDGVERGENVMGAPLNNQFQRRINLEFVDDAGKDEPVQKGSVQATSSDPSVATIAVDPSEAFAIITPAQKGVSDSGVDDQGAPKELLFTFAADADRTAGVQQISGTYSCAVVGPNATSIKATEGGDSPLP